MITNCIQKSVYLTKLHPDLYRTVKNNLVYVGFWFFLGFFFWGGGGVKNHVSRTTWYMTKYHVVDITLYWKCYTHQYGIICHIIVLPCHEWMSGSKCIYARGVVLTYPINIIKSEWSPAPLGFTYRNQLQNACSNKCLQYISTYFSIIAGYSESWDTDFCIQWDWVINEKISHETKSSEILSHLSRTVYINQYHLTNLHPAFIPYCQ